MQQEGAGGQSKAGETLTGALFFGFCVLQAGLILFPGLWVKVKLHGLCKVHNSSTNEAPLFSFEKNHQVRALSPRGIPGL